MEMRNNLDWLKLIAGVGGILNAIFLSDTTTMDGNFVKEHALSENSECLRRSTYNFTRESPTKEDLKIWKYFLISLMLENFELLTPQGNWIFLSHRVWEWVTNDMNWLLEWMKVCTLVWCEDGSYKRNVAPFVSGAGWMVFCTKSGKTTEGNCFEYSDSTNAYIA